MSKKDANYRRGYNKGYQAGRQKIEALKKTISTYQQVCASAYQLAGVVGAPLRFLDVLGDAANGELGKRSDPDKLLPVDLSECDGMQQWPFKEPVL